MRLQTQNDWQQGRYEPDDIVVEALLALPGGQLRKLEVAARQRGLSTGQLLRALADDFLAREQPLPPRELSSQNGRLGAKTASP